jgi:hypothetical protein
MLREFGPQFLWAGVCLSKQAFPGTLFNRSLADDRFGTATKARRKNLVYSHRVPWFLRARAAGIRRLRGAAVGDIAPLPIWPRAVPRFSAFETERCERAFALPTDVRFFLEALAAFDTLLGFGEFVRDLLVFI